MVEPRSQPLALLDDCWLDEVAGVTSAQNCVPGSHVGTISAQICEPRLHSGDEDADDEATDAPRADEAAADADSDASDTGDELLADDAALLDDPTGVTSAHSCVPGSQFGTRSAQISSPKSHTDWLADELLVGWQQQVFGLV